MSARAGEAIRPVALRRLGTLADEVIRAHPDWLAALTRDYDPPVGPAGVAVLPHVAAQWDACRAPSRQECEDWVDAHMRDNCLASRAMWQQWAAERAAADTGPSRARARAANTRGPMAGPAVTGPEDGGQAAIAAPEPAPDDTAAMTRFLSLHDGLEGDGQ